MSLPDLKMAERNILRGRRGHLNKAAAALVPEGCWWDAAESGSAVGCWITPCCGATCALGTQPPAKAGQGPGNHREAARAIPLRLVVLE